MSISSTTPSSRTSRRRPTISTSSSVNIVSPAGTSGKPIARHQRTESSWATPARAATSSWVSVGGAILNAR